MARTKDKAKETYPEIKLTREGTMMKSNVKKIAKACGEAMHLPPNTTLNLPISLPL